MPQTSITVTEYTDSNDVERTQYRTTVPKSLAEAMGLEQGNRLEWSVASGSALRVEVKDD